MKNIFNYLVKENGMTMKKTLITRFLVAMFLMTILVAGVSTVKAQILLQDSFEKTKLNTNIWDVTWWTPDGQLSEGIDPEMVDYPVRSGKYSVKIRAQANWNGHDNYSRTEIQGKRNDTGSHTTFFYPGKEYWIGFSIYLPRNWQADNKSREVIFQLHGNGGGGQYQIPPFALTVDGEDWYWGISSDQDPTPDEADEYGRTTLIKGEWVDFVIHAKFSYSNDGYGFYEIWRNGETLFTRNGPNCYNDAHKIRGPQTGIYKWDWSQSGVYEVSDRTMYLDEIKVGGKNSSYDDVAPGGGYVSNVALNKTVTYSSQENDNNRAAENIVDGIDDDENKFWAASPMPQWVEVDLGKNYSISRAEVVCYLNRSYRFKIEVRKDDSSAYVQVVDRLDNTQQGTIAHPICDNFSNIDARYVRITVVESGDSTIYDGSWASIAELRILGKDCLTAIRDKSPEIPKLFNLKNYPNPFNPSTKVSFFIPQNGHVTVKVYNIMGKEIIKLADRVFTAGEQDLQWNGYDKNGNIVSSGVYFCSVQYKNQLKTNKMILVR